MKNEYVLIKIANQLKIARYAIKRFLRKYKINIRNRKEQITIDWRKIKNGSYESYKS